MIKVSSIYFLLIMVTAWIWPDLPAYGQDRPAKQKLPVSKSYTIKKSKTGIKIDGKLDEQAWKEAEIIELPYEFLPGDNTPAPVKTECMVTFSNGKLYIGSRCYDPNPREIRAHLMDRDAFATFVQDDHIGILIDTYNDERRAFDFRVNPLGVQVDGIFSQVDFTQDFSWDAIWESAGRKTGYGYEVEIAIPFNQLRYPREQGKQTWGFGFTRSYPRRVRYRFSSHPLDRDIDRFLHLFNKITGFENLDTGWNLEIDPTLTIQRTDRPGVSSPGELKPGKINSEPGITVRWGITPGLMLNGTVNPDFSQVEADAAQLEVNTRFALRYAEKRPFFLEGADFFRTPLEAVFTRTVINPRWGIKMTGKTGRSAVGFFLNQDRCNNLLFPANQETRDTVIEENVLGGVFRYRRDVGKDSILGVLYTGRLSESCANHVAGVDGTLRLSHTKNISFQYLHTQTRYSHEISVEYNQPHERFRGRGIFFSLMHSSRHLGYGVDYEDLSAGFRTDFGFIPRVDIRRYSAFLQPIIWGKRGGWFDKIFFTTAVDYITNQQGQLTDQVLQVAINYQGPLQTVIQPLFLNKKERYNDSIYDLDQLRVYLEMKPAGGLKFSLSTSVGDSIDYANTRPAHSLLLNPGAELGLGRHLNINLNHIVEVLSLKGEKIYTVHLFQTRLIYNFNVRTFIRAIIQYMDINRNVFLYSFPVEPVTRTLLTQLLFSYKINPQTVLFIGYSDNHLGLKGIDLTRKDRTFFLKIGYALVL